MIDVVIFVIIKAQIRDFFKYVFVRRYERVFWMKSKHFVEED